jgi:hypothetical protein
MVRSAATPRVSNHEATDRTARNTRYRARATFGSFTTRSLSSSSA